MATCPLTVALQAWRSCSLERRHHSSLQPPQPPPSGREATSRPPAATRNAW